MFNCWRACYIRRMKTVALPVLIFTCLIGSSAMSRCADLGIFEGQADVGKVGKTAPATFESGGTYVISGGGENMWFTNDDFHFVWKKMSGDFRLQAAIEWAAAGGNAHRKACLM